MTDPHPTEMPDHSAPSGDHDRDAVDHGETHGHEHAHSDAELGPVDIAAWGAGVLGIVIAVMIAACFVLATSGIG